MWVVVVAVVVVVVVCGLLLLLMVVCMWVVIVVVIYVSVNKLKILTAKLGPWKTGKAFKVGVSCF